MSPADPAGPPVLRVVRGDAAPEEIAALVAVLAAQARSASARPGGGRGTRSAWGDRSAMLRRPLPHGPDAWRLTARRGLA
jgi:hypothetical protein